MFVVGNKYLLDFVEYILYYVYIYIYTSHGNAFPFFIRLMHLPSTDNNDVKNSVSGYPTYKEKIKRRPGGRAEGETV